MKFKFVPVDYAYFDFEGRNYVKIYGRDEKGKRICAIDSCDIYFWAILSDKLDKKSTERIVERIRGIELDVKGRNTKVEKVEIHDKKYMGKDVKALKIFATNYKDLHDIADHLGMEGIEKRRGYDIGFVSHYIMEKKIIPLTWYEIEGEILNGSDEFGGIDSSLNVDFCVKLGSAKKSEDKEFSPKVLAFDIETDEFRIGKGHILMLSMVSEGMKKVITWKKLKDHNPDYVEYVKDEKELLQRFVETVKEVSPDFIVGYFSDGFDMPYIKERADKNKVKLSLSLNGSQPVFHRGVMITCKTEGVVHVDLLKFVETAYSQYMQSETLSLNDVAKEFLGDTKKDFKFKPVSKIEEEEWKVFFEYNLQDSVLTYNLFKKFWPDMLEFSRVINEPIVDVSRNGMSRNVESYILHSLDDFNEIPEKRPPHDEIGSRRRMGKYEGAFVFQPIPGLYEDLVFFDFTSMYASVIVTYNLSASTLLERKKKDSTEVDLEGEKVYFNKDKGFFPAILEEIIKKRKKYKQEYKDNPSAIFRARSNAFKLLANAAYGYLGFFGARYYCREAAASTAALARKAILDTIEKIKNEGYKVVYSDTDSIAFLTGGKSNKQIKELLSDLNDKLPGIMALDLEGFFKRGIWVTKRSGDFGAKKKYALIDEDNKMKIRGFETVRRDWCPLARETQNKVLRMILEDGNEKKALDYVKEISKKMKARKISREKLLIRTQLKKPISEYKSISPHVIAAKRMQEQDIPIDEGALIEYYIAEPEEGSKKKLVRDRVKLATEEGDYDIDYYLKHQILPAVENIMQVFGINIDNVLEKKNQMTLDSF